MSREHDLRILGVRAIQQHRVAEHLRDLAVGPLRDRIGGVVAIERRGLADLDLHQLVIAERLIDRRDESVVDTALADLDDRLEIMTQTAEMTTLLAGEHGGL
jgi:hypothetical protein